VSACEAAIKAAAAIDEMADTVTDLDPAILACDSLADFSSAAARYPTALDGADATNFVRTRCAAIDSLASSPVCAEFA